MRKLGFICEGATERKIVESDIFKRTLSDFELGFLQAIDTKGKGEIAKHKIDPYISILKANGADLIIVLTDLDEDACITRTKERIGLEYVDAIIIAVRQIEAWFLADTNCMDAILGINVLIEAPESYRDPFSTIQGLLREHKEGRGVGDKIRLAAKCLWNGFSIAKAAEHPHCASAKYFMNKLSAL